MRIQGPIYKAKRGHLAERNYAFHLNDKKGARNRSALDMMHRRLVALSCLFFLLLGGVSVRLFQLSLAVWGGATSNYHHTNSSRADITDRNGYLLATSVRTFSLYATPHVMTRPWEVAKRLQRIFPELNLRKLALKLNSKKRFSWIMRHLTPQKQEEVLRLGIPGLYVMKDQRRIYPGGSLFSHVVGFTDVDNHGISGIEKGIDERLKATPEPVQLSVDMRLQHILLKELQDSIDTFQAKAGNGMIVNIKTGEILAMGSLPDFDPNQRHTLNPECLFNRNTAGLYEFGSILKIPNVAMALEMGRTLASVYDASTPLVMGRFRITDFKGKNRPLSIQEAFLFSSNIANAKIALDAGGENQRDFLRKVGFFDSLPLELPEVATPLSPKSWTDTTTVTASYGYGFSVTAAHMVRSIGALLSGYKRDLTLLTRSESFTGARVVSRQTAAKMRFLLRAAVSYGQAKNGAVAHYDVGGKTGTANILVNGKYARQNNIVTFVSVLPISDPNYILLVSLDRPKPSVATYGYATAGWSAAPLAARIMKQVAPILGIPLLPEGEGDSRPDNQMFWSASAVHRTNIEE